MSRTRPQVTVPIEWNIARNDLAKLLSEHARIINGKLDGEDQGETGTSTASFTATNKPGANNKTSPDTWIQVNLNGTVYYVPAFLP